MGSIHATPNLVHWNVFRHCRRIARVQGYQHKKSIGHVLVGVKYKISVLRKKGHIGKEASEEVTAAIYIVENGTSRPLGIGNLIHF